MGNCFNCFKSPEIEQLPDEEEPFLIHQPSEKPSGELSLDSFHIEKLLGKGTFGKVMLVRKKDTNAIYAMKVIKKSLIEKYRYVDHTKTERKILGELDNPFLVKLRYAFQSKTKVYMVMDFINGGELFFHLEREKFFTEDRAQFYAAEILLGLEYLHSQGIVYRDLKAENILLESSGHIKLTDFGLSKKYLASGNSQTFSMCGTPEYLAPEILLGVGHDNAVDYWSFGVLLYEMLAGELPFDSENNQDLYKKIIKADYNMKSFFSNESVDLLKKLLNPHKQLRLKDPEQIKAHPFFKGIKWDKLLKKEVEPIFKPKIENEKDLGNFDKVYTDEKLQDSMASNLVSSHMFQKLDGFTYTQSPRFEMTTEI
ncbi:hypothetical protein SteCoe_2828 [Stentor coeruleus]|uniref:Non-specific serine/threonine protein kinase n=1 Tax=Stentor coeruleus TaxID=5963 RepID=A0A1R2CYJ2_9CILI|nr:hypothetical protein SteCoe_2828 [Stentor coeruleus]